MTIVQSNNDGVIGSLRGLLERGNGADGRQDGMTDGPDTLNPGRGHGRHDGGPQGPGNHEGNGPPTGGNNPASVDGGNQGNQGTHGNHGNHGNQGTPGNHGGSGDYGHPGNMNTVGPTTRGPVDLPRPVPPLCNSPFSVANALP